MSAKQSLSPSVSPASGATAAAPRVSRTIEEVRASVFGYVESVQDNLAARGYLPARLNLNKGVVRGLLEIFCWGYWQIYSLLERLLTQATPSSATGAWLDMHAAGVDLSRRAATKARGKVRFLRAAQGSLEANVTIPAGRIVRTLPDGAGRIYRYGTTDTAVLPAGADFVGVPVEAEDYGQRQRRADMRTGDAGHGHFRGDESRRVADGGRGGRGNGRATAGAIRPAMAGQQRLHQIRLYGLGLVCSGRNLRFHP